MLKEHMKNNEVDLDEVTPNLVPPKEKLDLWKDMLEHPENHENDWTRLEENRIKHHQERIERLKQMVETGLSRKGRKLTERELYTIKQDYERLSKERN